MDVLRHFRSRRARSRPRSRRRLTPRLAILSLVAGFICATVPFVAATVFTRTAAIDTTATYLLVAQHSGKALDVGGWSTADGTPVQQWTRNNGANQRWRLTAAGDGYYRIINVNSGKALDVSGWSTADGAPVVQWTDTGGANQQWQIADAASGTVKIVNRNSGKVLDVSGWSTADGARVVQWTDTGGANQQWSLVTVGTTPAATTATTATTATATSPSPTTSRGTNTATATAQPAATGPYQWRNAEIVGGGFVTGIIFNPARQDLVYARTDMGGAYRWNPSTGRWIPLTDQIAPDDWTLMGIESLATDPVEPDRVYLAAGTYTNDWSGNGAILRSANQGASFQRTNLPFKLGGNENGRSMGERMAIDPNKNSTLYLGTRNNGLWRSTDFAATWSQVAGFPVTGPTSSVGISFVTFDPGSGSAGAGSKTIYVGVADTGTSLYRSTDGGASWQAVPGAPTGQLPQHGVLSSEGILYLTYSNGPGPSGITAGVVWKFNTHSGAWTDITPSTGSFGYAGVAVDRASPSTVMVTTMDRWWPHDEVYRSTNGGASWTALGEKAVRDASAAPYIGNESIGHWMGDIEIDPFNSNNVMYTTGNGIWGSDDAGVADSGGATHWTIRARGLEETSVIDLIAPPGGASVISALGDVSGFRHDDLTTVPPRAMINPRFNNTSGIDFAEAAPSVVVRVGTGAAPYGALSTDGGASWTPFAGTPSSGGEGGTIAASADGSTFVWTPSGKVPSYSRDRGKTWAASGGLPTDATVIADRARAGTFYSLVSGSLYVCTNNGATFSTRSSGLAAGQLKAVPGREGDLWIPSANGLFHSTNGGTSFTKLSSVTEAAGIGFGKPAPGRSYQALYITGRVNGVQGVFRSDDSGVTWIRINDDAHQWGWLGRTITGDPDVYGRVYIGTNGRGVQYGSPS